MSPNEWELMEILMKMLAPIQHATTILQGRKYHTLSISKIIETQVLKFYEKAMNATDPKIKENEKLIAKMLHRSLTRNLITKISKKQARAALVCQKYTEIKFQK
jgi:hypothetical protein